jgi:hypothetical protein
LLDELAMPNDDSWRRLLHRWLVEFNPIYLLSAALVLFGMFLVSKGLGQSAGLVGPIGVAAIAELYAVLLVGGAALLTRIGQRRPAVMLALIAMLYQCDLTLHTETCANLGGAGAAAAIAWLVLFGGKLRALVWALRLRVSREAMATLLTGGAGVAAMPFLLPRMDDRAGGALVALWLCALVIAHRDAAVTSLVDLDAWGQTVLRRSVRGSWTIASVLLALHVLFWGHSALLHLGPVMALVPLLATRWIRRERPVWVATLGVLLVVAIQAPSSFAVTALVAAIMLADRARVAARTPDESVAVRMATPGPYRAIDGATPEVSVLEPEPVVPGGRAAAMRLLTGAALALYLSAWTASWTGGPWPAHIITLDVVAAAVVVFVVSRHRVRIALAPLSVGALHGLCSARIVAAPHSLVGWGGAALALGFALLLGSLAASYFLRQAHFTCADPEK